jgi:hypothetical protein
MAGTLPDDESCARLWSSPLADHLRSRVEARD